MASSATFQIDVGSGYGTAGEAQNAAAGASVSCRLVSVSGIRPGLISWSITGTSGETAPTITLSGTPVGQVATFTMPSTADGSAVGVTCKVNGGTVTSGRTEDTAKSAVYVLDPSGRRPFFYGETNERDATYGIVPTLNDLMSSVAPAGATDYAHAGEDELAGGAGATALDSYTHGLTNGVLTVYARAEAQDTAGNTALYDYRQQWSVSSGTLAQDRDVSPIVSEDVGTWDFEIYDAGSGAIGIRGTPDGTNTTTFKWQWDISAITRPS